MSYQTNARTSDMTTVQKVAAAVGAVFLLVGVAGFIPGITTNYDAMEFAGHESGAKLLDVFQVSILHNIVHLLFGVAGLALARTFSGARTFLIGGGVIYLALFVYGMVIDRADDANFVPLNEADDYLHLVLGLGMVGLGALLGRDGVDRHGRDGVGRH
ncbi:MAG TPA: DUF4383 domain-containing protein [Nocardioidaceae bacterium]|nr:DUF4383 domain-containing protein [Nocardioidaceae bacterium]